MWVFNGYALPLADDSRVDPRIATLGYRANFLSNFNLDLIIYLLPLTAALAMLAYKKLRKVRSHRLEIVIKTVGEDWQLTAMLFSLQPLVFAFVINLTYSTSKIPKIAGIIVGLILIAILTLYLYHYYQKAEDSMPQKLRFSEFKKPLRAEQRNFYIWIVLYRGLLSLGMVTVSESIVSESVILVLICGWIVVLFVKRPYCYQLELAPLVNSFVMLALASLFLYTRSAADFP